MRKSTGFWLIVISALYLTVGMINLFAMQFIDIVFLQMFYIAALLVLLLFKYKSDRPASNKNSQAPPVRNPDGININIPLRDIVRPKNPPPAPPKIKR